MAASKIIVNIQTPFVHKNGLLPRGKQLAYSISNEDDMRELFSLMNNPRSRNGVYMSERDKELFDKHVKSKYDRFGNSVFRESNEMNSAYLTPPLDPEESPFLNPVVMSKKEDETVDTESNEEVEKGITTLLMESEKKESEDSSSQEDKSVEEVNSQDSSNIEETTQVEEVSKTEDTVIDKSVFEEDLKKQFEERFEHLTDAHYKKIQERAESLGIEYTVKDATILEILENEFLESAINLGIEDTLEELLNSKKK